MVITMLYCLIMITVISKVKKLNKYLHYNIHMDNKYSKLEGALEFCKVKKGKVKTKVFLIK